MKNNRPKLYQKKHALTHQIVQQILSKEVTFLYLEYKIINKENMTIRAKGVAQF